MDRERLRVAKLAAAGIVLVIIVGTVLSLYGFHAELPAKHDQVAYYFDQDLVRFMKFSAGVLAIFVTVGIFLWGFDVKKASQEVKESRDETRKLLDEVRLTLDDVRKKSEDVDQKSKDVDQKSREVEQKSRDIVKEAEGVAAMRTQIEEMRIEIGQLLTRSKTEFGSIMRFRRRLITLGPEPEPKVAGRPAAHGARFFSVPQLAQLYNFPTSLDGRGQAIGLIELAGQYP